MLAGVKEAKGAKHAGVASGVLNTARQSGGALGVAVLGSLLGHASGLHVPLLVATAGHLVAIALAWTTIRGTRERRAAR